MFSLRSFFPLLLNTSWTVRCRSSPPRRNDSLIYPVLSLIEKTGPPGLFASSNTTATAITKYLLERASALLGSVFSRTSSHNAFSHVKKLLHRNARSKDTKQVALFPSDQVHTIFAVDNKSLSRDLEGFSSSGA